MSFDKIIANPPFDKNLHLKILREAMKHIEKEGGEIVSLEPCGWIQRPFAKKSYGDAFKSMCPVMKDRIKDIEVIPIKEANQLFGIGLESDLGIYTIVGDNEGSFDYDNWYKTQCKEELEQIERFSKFDKIKNHLTKYNGQKYFVPLRKDSNMDRWWKYQLINYLDAIIDGKVYSGEYAGKTIVEAREANPHENGRNNDRATFGVAFDSKNEALNFRDMVKSRPYIYIISLFKKFKAFPFDRLPFLPTYKKPWDDKQLYEYFNLTPEEIKEIENAI
jgi:hypothetical protein